MTAALNFYQAMALALLQGITEFLPVSSSGHLVLARRLFGWSDDGGLVFDTVLHAGSLLAILIYFWRDWLEICRAYFLRSKIENRPPKAGPPLAEKSVIENSDSAYYRRLPWLIIIATIPVVIAGPFLQPFLESGEEIRNAGATGVSMIMTAFIFFLAEHHGRADGKERINFLNALFIGCMQIVALLPGASRSGWTASAGILCGQKRENAVRFAFLMAVPAIAGAIIFQAKDIIGMPQTGLNPALILSGFTASFVASLFAIHFCLKYFRNHSLKPFAAYLLAIGIVALLIK